MATQQELEEFLATQEPGQFTPTPATRRRRVPATRQVSPAADVLAVEAATQLAPGASFGGGELDVVSRHLAGGTPGPGPALVEPTRPATRLAVPEQKSIIDVPGVTPTAPGIDVAPAVDRYQGLFDEATRALAAFESQPEPATETERRQRFSSPERVNLIRRQRQAKELLQGGSFADVGNLRLEQRKQQAAAAQNLLAQAAGTQLETELLPQALAELEAPRKQKRTGITDTQFDQLLQRATR